jgi:hypothetical protein
MNKQLRLLICSFFTLYSQLNYAGPEQAQMSVWVNEAVVATYSYGYKNYLEDQRQIAKYFTVDGWINYTKALNDSKLPEVVQKNRYVVSAVATKPPLITGIDATHWSATMDLLVVYQNDEYQQKQNVKINIKFTETPSGQGVKGFSINSLESIAIKAPCECPTEKEPSQNKS